jgi:tetratricopeptide (TPR) repeat protein
MSKPKFHYAATRIVMLSALSMTLVIGLAATVGPAFANPEYDRHYELGKDFLQRQEYKLAVQELSLAIDKPASPVQTAAALVDRGTAYSEQKNYVGALADLDRAITLDGKSHLAFNNRGAVYYRQGQADKAIADFDKALALDNDDKYAVINRAGAYLLTDRAAKLALNTENWIQAKKWKSEFSAQAAVLTILAYISGGDKAHAQALTQTALKSVDKLPWPYAMLKYFDKKADPEAVVESAQDSTYDLMQAQCYLGLDDYFKGKEFSSLAREKLGFVTKHGTTNSVEYWLGKYYLPKVASPAQKAVAPTNTATPSKSGNPSKPVKTNGR